MSNPPLVQNDDSTLDLILNRVPMLIVYLDGNQNIAYANQRFAAFIECERELLLGRSIIEVCDGLKNLETEIQQAYQGMSTEGQISVAKNSEPSRYLDLSFIPNIDSVGEVAGCYVFIKDVTKTKQHERMTNLVFAHMPAFIALFDANMKFRYVNDRLLETLGRSAADVLGHSIQDILHESSFQVSEPNLKLALQGEKRVYENTLIRGDGSQIHVLVHLVPEKDHFGEITGICALLVDRSALKQAHEELRHKELRIQSAVEGSSVGIIEFDIDNPDWVFAEHVESLLGFEEGELENSRSMIRSRIHPDDVEINEAAKIDEASGKDTQIEIRLKTKASGYRWFSINSRIVRDEHQRPNRVIGTITDIDDLKNAQLKATEEVRRKDEFLAMLSHELRNPMAAVTFSLDCLNECDQLPDDARNLIDIISRQTNQMSKLLQDLLDVSRLNKNRINFEFVPHDLNQFIPDAVNSIRPRIAKKHQNLHLRISDSPLPIRGDITRLKQAMANLLDNASKYTPEEGDIWLETVLENDNAIFIVRDSGYGLDANSQESIFELFYQAPKTAGNRSGGIGVGLFLVDQIVKAHGGTVKATSSGIGKGSQFSIHLPTIDSENLLHQDADIKNDETFRRVLLVEDNLDSLNSLSSLLRGRGFEVECYSNGVQLSQTLSKLRFDVAIIDVELPGKSGLELARELRQHADHHDKRLIALTGYGQTHDRMAASEAGFDFHITKPAKIDQLTDLILG